MLDVTRRNSKKSNMQQVFHDGRPAGEAALIFCQAEVSKWDPVRFLPDPKTSVLISDASSRLWHDFSIN